MANFGNLFKVVKTADTLKFIKDKVQEKAKDMLVGKPEKLAENQATEEQLKDKNPK